MYIIEEDGSSVVNTQDSVWIPESRQTWNTAVLQSELLHPQALSKLVCIKSSGQEWDISPYWEVQLHHGILKHPKNQGYLPNWEKARGIITETDYQESKTSLNGLFLQWRKSQKECQAVNIVRKGEFVV